MKSKEEKTTLSNVELIASCNEWVSSLAKTGGRSWTLSVPVNFNRDPDMLIVELGKRLLEKDKFAEQCVKAALDKAAHLTSTLHFTDNINEVVGQILELSPSEIVKEVAG